MSQGAFEGSVMRTKNKALPLDKLGFEAQLSHLLTLWPKESYLQLVMGAGYHASS